MFADTVGRCLNKTSSGFKYFKTSLQPRSIKAGITVCMQLYSLVPSGAFETC